VVVGVLARRRRARNWRAFSFGYDGNGNMTLASNSDGTYTMQYDPLGRVTFVKEPTGGEPDVWL
jgi:YD repeat-containing protein